MKEKEVFRKEFGKRLKARAQEKGYTAQKIQSELNLPNKHTVDSWYAGRCIPEAETLAALCKILDCNIDYLYGNSLEKGKRQQAAAEYTGLNEKAVDNIRKLPAGARTALKRILNDNPKDFAKLMESVQDCFRIPDEMEAQSETIYDTYAVMKEAKTAKEKRNYIELTIKPFWNSLNQLEGIQDAERFRASNTLVNMIDSITPPEAVPEAVKKIYEGIVQEYTEGIKTRKTTPGKGSPSHTEMD